MIGSRNLKSLKSPHPMPTCHHVLRHIVEHMPHVKDAGNIRRRNHDTERFLAAINFRIKDALTFPEGVDSSLHLCMIELRGNSLILLLWFHNTICRLRVAGLYQTLNLGQGPGARAAFPEVTCAYSTTELLYQPNPEL